MDPQVQTQLARREAETQGVPIDQGQAQRLADQELANAPDPAVKAAEVDATNAALSADALEDQEFARLAKEVVSNDPDQLVRDQLRVDPAAVDEQVTVVKAETGRGWEVYDVNGELYPNGRFTTKRGADRFADSQRKKAKEELAKRAQQMADDTAGEVLEIGTTGAIRDGSLTGKVALSQPQINEIMRYPNFRPFFEQFKVKRKTYEFTQADMATLVDGARALLQTGEIKGPRARVLNNLIDKLDTAIRTIEPQVRVQRQVDSLTEQTKRVLDHGDYC